MNNWNFNISGYSTALFSTWFFIEELGLLFDVGDGVSASLLQKSRKIKQVFISHADRDHLTGLFQFNQLNAREGLPIIHYPADSGSFPAIENFTEKFDPHVGGAVWKPIREKQSFKIKEQFFIESIRNNHVPAPADISKSLSYLVLHQKSKLKAEFRNLSGTEIQKIALEKGKDFISEIIKTKVLAYSGDTPIENFEHWDGVKTLIHEATFLNVEPHLNSHANKHSTLEEVLQKVSEIKIEQLILSHFSSRYSKEEIDTAIIKLSKELKINIPIYRILPGQTHFNILSEIPVNE